MLKGNQGSLHRYAKDWLEGPGNAETMQLHRQTGRGHGSAETRTATVCHDIGPPQDAHRWPGLPATGKIEAVRVSEGRIRTATRYYIMSRKLSPEDFLNVVWSHRAIENSPHWVFDVRMWEDELRNRVSRGAETLAGIRCQVLSMVRLMDDDLSIRRRSLRAAQVPDYRFKLISNAAKLAERI